MLIAVLVESPQYEPNVKSRTSNSRPQGGRAFFPRLFPRMDDGQIATLRLRIWHRAGCQALPCPLLSAISEKDFSLGMMMAVGVGGFAWLLVTSGSKNHSARQFSNPMLPIFMALLGANFVPIVDGPSLMAHVIL